MSGTREPPLGPPLLGAALSALLLLSAAGTASAAAADPLADGVGFGLSAALAGASELAVRFAPSLPLEPEQTRAALPAIDRAFMVPYSRDADVASSVLETAAMVAPLALVAVAPSPTDALGAAASYAEALAVAMAAKNFAKVFLPRYRPYAFTGGAPGTDPEELDQSFPSGHATMAFAAAAACAYIYATGLPGTRDMLPLVVVDAALAGLTGAYRVVAGVHYVTDVAAGAVLGVACGVLVPALIAQARR